MSNFRIGLLIALVLLLGIINHSTSRSVDFSASQNWQHFAGATTTREGLRIQPLDRHIIHQDGSRGQPNPPVNLAGSHLFVSGDFKLTARMEKIDTRATLRLYGSPPIIYDQWRYEPGSIAMEVATSSITVKIWDSSSSNSMDMRVYLFALRGAVNLSLERTGDSLTISANEQRLGDIPDHGIFAAGEVWFGADAGENDEWILSALTVESLRNGRARIISPASYDVPHDDPNSLRALATAHPRKLRIGAAIAHGPLVSDEKYRELALREFSMITPENGMKPQFIHPRRDTYVFNEIDTLVDIALKNDMLVHGHTLVYAKSSPEWMTKSPKGERPLILRSHVTTVASHFKGKVAEWDVVNEPLSNKKGPYKDARRGLDNNTWYEAMGEQYIDIAFHAAHDADPSAQLYLNDYGLERDGERWDALLSLIKRLQSRGVPIHGVGFESHVYGDGDYSDGKTLRAHMRTLANLGLKVRISEIDVAGDDPRAQIDQYVLALDACLREPNCTGYSTWGVTDLYGSTTRSDRYPLVYGTSLLFDTKFKQKPVYGALKQRLREP